MLPVLKPGFFPVTRDLRTLQLGRSATRTLVLPDDAGVRALLSALDGRRTWDQLLDDLATDGRVPRDRGAYLMRLLLDGGFVDDASTRSRALSAMPDSERHRLTDDVAAWSRSRPQPSSSVTTLLRRRACWVEVDGAGRLAVGTAHLLALAGLGHVSVRDRTASIVVTSDLAPLGPHEAALGRTVVESVRGSVQRTSAAAAEAGGPGRPGTHPDLVVIVGPPHSPRAQALVQRGTPHLFVHADAGHGVVGPLVVVGRTACGRCIEQHRVDADPARAWVVADAIDAAEGLDTITATATATLAAAQTLQHLDQQARADACDAMLRVEATSAMIHRIPAPTHPACGCTWSSAPGVEVRTMSA